MPPTMLQESLTSIGVHVQYGHNRNTQQFASESMTSDGQLTKNTV